MDRHSDHEERANPQSTDAVSTILSIDEDNTALHDPCSELFVEPEPLAQLEGSLPKAEEDVCFPSVTPSQNTNEIEYKALSDFLDHGRFEPHQRKLSSSRKRSISDYSLYNEEPRFTFFSSKIGTLKAYNMSEIATEKTSTEDLLRGGDFWLDILSPSDSELKWLSKIFHIHPLTAEDIQAEETREKCESFKNYYFVNFQTFDTYEQFNMAEAYVENSVSLFNIIRKDSIISIHYRPTPHLQNVLNRIEHLKDYIHVTPDWINYALMDSVVDALIPLVENLEMESDSIDELVFILKESEQSHLLRRIGNARKAISGVLRLLKPKGDVVKGVIKRTGSTLSEHAKQGDDMSLYLGDVQDHILTMVQNASHFEKILSRAHSNYLTQISIEITQSSNRTNDVVAKLTAVASIIVPMNIITGLWGMNVHVPGQDATSLSWFYGLVGFLVFTFICGVAIMIKHRIM
ncbi:CorA metal ion transporter [Basidiobolus ranarum]|uniref:CorA metal ion transporter n=1 Tax=Basidiobolus ranarum TaxID=34480 RepID=A0ABR2VW16_9FUNG